VVTHQLQVERRTVKVRLSETDVLPTVPRNQPTYGKSYMGFLRKPLLDHKIQDGGSPPSWKSGKLPYLNEKLPDFDEIWYTTARFAPDDQIWTCWQQLLHQQHVWVVLAVYFSPRFNLYEVGTAKLGYRDRETSTDLLNVVAYACVEDGWHWCHARRLVATGVYIRSLCEFIGGATMNSLSPVKKINATSCSENLSSGTCKQENK